MARSWTFILLTFGFSWALILCFYLAGGEWGTLASTFVALGMMFIPALVAIYLQKVKDKQPLRDIGLRWSFNRWWWVAWLALVFRQFDIFLLNNSLIR